MKLRLAFREEIWWFLVLALATSPLFSQTSSTGDLTEVNLEDLMNIEVTSASKKDQKLSRTASAMFVITREDIEHSGSTTLPDLLRMVPGVQVAQINASKWAISIRGFNGQYSNKLLVMVDGRTVFTPTLSGVFWDTQDLAIDDIERIEVIRGPGASVWGANAINGVINVITKNSDATQGLMTAAGGGTQQRWSAGARYGGRVGPRSSYRVFAYDFDGSHLPSIDGRNAVDDWRDSRAGFRADINASRRNTVTVEGQSYRGDAAEAAN